ncbi:MAG: ABC transporter permease [Bacillus sp. (in: Bacteria)]|nr:ABC transporter permease [Bacillus sp. (in: firmicutes)]MCM1425534.1 ABC transporter permease [Eubacterium sp.]
MYLRILKKDLKRKKTMNAIMLIFIILAAMFIASSANNLITVTTALDNYFAMADVPDYWFMTPYAEERGRFMEFATENNYRIKTAEFIRIDPPCATIDGEAFNYSNSIFLSTAASAKVFDEYGQEITHVNDGEIYINSDIFTSTGNNFYNGCKIKIDTGYVQKEFTLKGYDKDALFGSSVIDLTRFLISENDYLLFDTPDKTAFFSLMAYTEDENFMDKFNNLDLKTSTNINRSGVKMMYVMDTLIAAVVLVVSICLILISMVILRFTINFTMNEEFREIGVMKAIGIANGKIRALYLIKYLAISIIGASVGLTFSFPFGRLLLESVSRNIIITGGNNFYYNIIFAIVAAGIVVLFAYLCTGKVKKFSPIDAIKNGETGERYTKKSFIRLSGSFFPPVPFMALNDILSGVKKYLSMILIFTLGLLLIIIPVNTINTLQSDSLISLFNMADCDLFITQELLFSSNGHNKEMAEEKLSEVRQILYDNHIEADVFQEIMFRFTTSHNGKKCSSVAFQGIGGVMTTQYSYLEGTPPQHSGEIALSHIVADNIKANIGDTVEVNIGDESRSYIVTAIYQSMNNLGEGIRFYQGEELNYDFAAGSFGVQILYHDSPDKETKAARKELLQKAYPDNNVHTPGEYVSYMTGDIAGQLEDVKTLILAIVICINVLVALLMVKSFITKEKGEIAILKAVGFQNTSLIAWQSMRIGIVLLIAILINTAVSAPLSKLIIEPIFKMIGAYSITFDIIPLEVYVIYPLAVLMATVLAAVIGALQLRKISAAETGNIE